MRRPFLLAMMAASLLLAHAAVAGVGCPSGTAKKTTICHVPADDPARSQTLCIGNEAVRAHLDRHPGDGIGRCGLDSCGNGLCQPELGETAAGCADDCRCDCQAAVSSTGLAADLGSVLGLGSVGLTGAVCSDCTAGESSLALSFSPSLEVGSTSFTFTAGTVGAPECSLLDDVSGPLGTVVVSGEGTIAVESQQQSTTFTLTLVKVAGLVCTGILTLDSATALGLPTALTVPLSIPCGDLFLQACPAS